MDKRALYRAKLKEQKQKRIDSPLVRYNKHNHPVCRVCDIVLKSESQWPGHQASRKHHEAINNIKANAAAVKSPNTVRSDPPKEFPKPKSELHNGISRKELEASFGLSKPRASSTLPPNFFDNQETKRPKIEKDSTRLGDHVSNRHAPVSDQTEEQEPSLSRSSMQGLSSSKNAETRSTENQRSGENGPLSKLSSGSDAKQVKGALPAGSLITKMPTYVLVVLHQSNQMSRQFRDARAMKTPDAELAHEGSNIFRECFVGVEDDSEPGVSFVFNEDSCFLKRAMVLHREAFFKSRAELTRCEAELKKLLKEKDGLKLLYVRNEEEITTF